MTMTLIFHQQQGRAQRMRNVGHVESALDMGRLNSRNETDIIIAESANRWGARKPSTGEKNRIIQWMRDQVKARFLYDYKADLDMDSGRIVFQTSQDDEDRGGPWILPADGRTGLAHDDNGVSMDTVLRQCEDSYTEYTHTAISYSMAGLEQHDRKP